MSRGEANDHIFKLQIGMENQPTLLGKSWVRSSLICRNYYFWPPNQQVRVPDYVRLQEPSPVRAN